MYFLPPARMRCPYPMRALELWFTLRWLNGDEQRALLQRQRSARQITPPEIPGPVLGTASHVLIGALAPWLRLRGEAFYRIPQVYQIVAHLDELRRNRQAMQLFDDEMFRILEARKQLLPGINVFAVWAGFVRHDKDNPIDVDDFPLETAIAEYEIFSMLVVDPGSLQLIVSVISSAIETNFKEDLKMLRRKKAPQTSENEAEVAEPYNESPL